LIILVFIAVIYFAISPKSIPVVIAATAPFSLIWKIFGIQMGLIDAVVIGGIIGLAINSWQRNPQPVPFKILLWIYVLISMIATLFAPIPKDPFLKYLWAMYKMASLTVSFILMLAFLKDKQQLQKMILVLLISSTVAAGFGLLQVVTQKPITIALGVYGAFIKGAIENMNSNSAAEVGSVLLYTNDTLRAFGTDWDANMFGGFLIWPLSIAISMFLINKEMKHRNYLLMSIVIMSGAEFLSLSREAWGGCAAAIAIVAIGALKYIKIKHILFPIIGLVIVIGALSAMGNRHVADLQQRVFSLKSVDKAKDDPAMAPRYTRWQYYFEKSLKRPLIGWGQITNNDDIEALQYAISPHNSYIFMAVMRGYIALSIFIILVVLVGKHALKSYKSTTDPFFKSINLGFFAATIGFFCITAWFDSFINEYQTTVIFWLIAAIAFRSKQIEIEYNAAQCIDNNVALIE
jgi:hypothetical protein